MRVRVIVHRDADLGVPDDVLDDVRGNAHRVQERHAGAPQVVQPDVRQVQAVGQFVEAARDITLFDGVTMGVLEHQGGLGREITHSPMSFYAVRFRSRPVSVKSSQPSKGSKYFRANTATLANGSAYASI